MRQRGDDALEELDAVEAHALIVHLQHIANLAPQLLYVLPSLAHLKVDTLALGHPLSIKVSITVDRHISTSFTCV